jgi:hypothetical protein
VIDSGAGAAGQGLVGQPVAARLVACLVASQSIASASNVGDGPRRRSLRGSVRPAFTSASNSAASPSVGNIRACSIRRSSRHRTR